MGRWNGSTPRQEWRVEGQRFRQEEILPSRTLHPSPATRDLLGRPLGSLRISVTDRCNLRCAYCMPEEHYTWLPKASLLSFEEITRLAKIFVGLGATKLRLTGGEPLLRHDLSALVRMLRDEAKPSDLAMTTNGMLLAAHASGLLASGLKRVTVSLDT